MNCPICQNPVEVRKFTFPSSIKIQCKNGCYYKRKTTASTLYIVFEQEFTILREESILNKISIKLAIRKKIKYWKKDYRYLAKILVSK